jgi:hypothetical protein
MTSQKEFLQKLIKALETSKIPYMLSGSMCSSFHGQPRATNDADIVINPTKEQLLHFVTSLGPDYYASQEAALQSLKNNSMFNIIDIQAGWKADFIIRKKRAYSEQEFSRRKDANVMGMDLSIVSPEDSILSKLEWSKDRESQAQFNDAMGVLMVQWDRLDFDYMKKWAKELKIEDSLEQLLTEVKKLRT